MLKWIRDNKAFFIGLSLLFVARASFADHYIVPTGSMEFTLLPGDRVLVDKRAYGYRIPLTEIKLIAAGSPARGDVVVFDAPDTGVRLIKRVVAVGSDVVEVRRCQVLINGRAVSTFASPSVEKFADKASTLNLQMGGGPDVPPTLVPDGTVFVLGDFRGNSRDSRWFGFVPEASLYARALRVYYRSEQGPVWLPL